MNIEEVKEIARGRGIKAGRMKKADIIRAIQIMEENLPCFETGRSAECGEGGCLWREDCR